MKLKKYLTLTRAGVIESLQFRLSTLIMIVGNLLYLIIVYFLWKAIYASAGTDTVSGMTFTETLYLLQHCLVLWKCTRCGRSEEIFSREKSFWIF